MNFTITKDQKQRFAQDGIVKLPGLISIELLAELDACFEWSVAHPGPLASGKTDRDDFSFVDNGNPEAKSMYDEIVARSGFGEVIAELLDSQYVGYFAEEIFWKKGRSNPTFWHQDTAYQPWSGEHWCNMWIPLMPMSADQSVQIIKGSHKGIQYDGTTFNPKNPTQALWGGAAKFPPLPDITADVAENPESWAVLGFDLVPGDVLVFHPHCLHRGGGTDSNMPERRNMVFRFFGDKAYYSDHLPKTGGMYTLKPIAASGGGYLTDGDRYRPADNIQVF
tara:strand:+ start:332 stop:1168 length:837 start_codon:yes stop_codon:yes gene_type:complete